MSFWFWQIKADIFFVFVFIWPCIKSSSDSLESSSVSIMSSAMMDARLLLIYFNDLSELIFFIFI
jgi:hypothetical protein